MTRCEQHYRRAACDADDRAETCTRIIRVSGDLRLRSTLAALHQQSDAAICPGQRRVVLDLAEVDAADSRLVAELVSIARRARRFGVELDLRLSRGIDTWVRIFRLERVLPPADCA